MRSLAVDTETTGTNVWTGARPFAVSAAASRRRTWYWEWEVDPLTRTPIVDPDDVHEIRELILQPGLRLEFWHAKFDALMLDAIGVDLTQKIDDGEIDEVLFKVKCCHNLEYSYKLKDMARKYAGIGNADEVELHAQVVRARRAAKRLGWPRAEDLQADYWMPETIRRRSIKEHRRAGLKRGVCKKYAVLDAVRTRELGELFDYGMDDLGVREVYEREMALWPHVLEAERHGVLVDEATIVDLRARCVEARDAHLGTLATAAGNDAFNPNSPKQVGDLLFGGGRLPVLKKTKTGQPKTDAEALVPHKRDPLVHALLAHRANDQAVRLFFDKYAEVGERCRHGLILHPGYEQYGTLTARFSCRDPNLQQVSDPDTTNSRAAEYVVDIRVAFGPRPGMVWYCLDYAQVEVIIFADISGEPALIEAILRGDDIHAVTAEKIWGGEGNLEAFLELADGDRGLAIDLAESSGWRITDAEKVVDKKIFRKRSKSVTFTKIFGGGPNALMSWIGCDKRLAVRILGDYDRAFPTMVARMGEIESRGRRDGFVTNPFGRRLAVDRWYAYRAVNHVVQSAAADLMKIGMTRACAYLRETGLDARLVMTIHDELVFEFRREHAFKRVLRRLRDLMSDHGGALSIPTPVDVERVTRRWSDKEKVEL